MNAAQFCGEYGHENKNGSISFRKSIVDKFITIYTYLTPDDFTKEMRDRLKIGLMIDLHRQGYTKYGNYKELPIEKIELSDFIFK